MSSASLLPAGLLVLLTALAPTPGPAQALSDSLRAEALRDFHGPDRTGKDGPLAKAGLDLLLLYHEYRAYRQGGAEKPFSPSLSGVQVRNGHVTIDAVATTSAERLHADLTALGFEDAAMAGRVVSGRLPITQVPALAELASLRGVVLPQAKTQSSRPSRPGAPTAAPSAPSLSETSSAPSGTGVLFFLGGVLGLFVLTEW